nr:hypothetical protein CFP56_14938 [Quercus suber]
MTIRTSFTSDTKFSIHAIQLHKRRTLFVCHLNHLVGSFHTRNIRAQSITHMPNDNYYILLCIYLNYMNKRILQMVEVKKESQNRLLRRQHVQLSLQGSKWW